MFGLIWTSDSGVNEDKTNRHFLVSIMMAVQQALIPEHCHIKLNNAFATMQRPPSPPTALSLAPSQGYTEIRGPVRVSIDLQFQLHSVSVHISAKTPHIWHLKAFLLLKLLDFHQWLTPCLFLCNYGSLFAQHGLSGEFSTLNDPALRSDTGFDKNKRWCTCERDIERHFVRLLTSLSPQQSVLLHWSSNSHQES